MAKLRLYRNISAIYNRNFPTGIYGVDPANAWSEASLTWSNQPSTLAGSDPQLNPRVTGDLHGGRVAISAIDPNNLVWVDANSTVGAVGRVYYSKDRGVSWVRATYGGSDLSIARIDPNEVQKHPLASDRVSGAFYLYSGLDNGAILRSIDGGATWSKLAATGDSSPNRPQCKILGVPGVADRFWIMTQYWNSPIRFQSWNGTSLVSRTEISNVVDFSFGKAAPGSLNPTVYVRKKDGTYWSSTNATAGGATWTQLSVSTINSGAIQLEADRQNYGRLYVGTGGRGIMYAGGTAEKTFYARDSFVKDGSDADINQAGTTSTTIDVKTDASPGNREGFLQFDFSGYAGTVSSATIILTPTASGTSGITNDIYFVPNSSWSEQTITWNSKPASSGAPLGSYTITAGSPITVPVTSQVQAAMGTGQKLSIRIACSAAANSLNMVTYASSENPNVNLQPVLRIVP